MAEPLNPYETPRSSAVSNPDVPKNDDISRQMRGIQYPLTLSFKVMALSNQATVTDATGRVVLYTKQKLLKFREHVEIFTNSDKTTLLAEIRTRKVIDWSARYVFTDSNGVELGSVGRRGWRSLWKAHYDVFRSGDNESDYSIQEENAMVKVLDSILGEIPILGFLTGYMFHPKYLASTSSGEQVMRVTKQAAFFEGRFQIDKLAELDEREELNLFLSYMMMLMLERRRG